MTTPVRLHQRIDWNSPDQQARLREELAAGLLAVKAAIAPKFFYDPLGSRLFDAITALPEYYPTRTEAEIFTTRLPEIHRALGEGCTLIDLGAASCTKAGKLFHAGIVPARYVAVDISVDFLREALHTLKRELPAIDMMGVGLDFTADFELPADVPAERRMFFYPGSSIGNFSPADALAFLKRLAAQLDGEGGLLIGVDLIKDKALLDAAYDDALGVTAAFNRNLLLHVNTQLGADFRLADWAHVAFYDIEQQRIEMHLEARRKLVVTWPGGQRRFAAGECIHTENSYKYSPEGFGALLAAAGFGDIEMWTDTRGWFALFFARPARLA